MSDTLKAALLHATALEDAFKAACKEVAGYGDHWAAYRADMRGEAWPAALIASHKAYIAALHAYYGLRDGPNGFLGGRGL